MQTVSIHETKTHLSRLIRQLAKGGEIIITSSGKPVARLAGIAPVKKSKRRPPKEFAAWGKKRLLPADLGDPVPDEWFDAEDEDEFYQP